MNLVGILTVAGTAAFWAGNLHVGQKLNVQIDHAGSVADRAAQLAGVVGEIVRPKAEPFGVLGFGKDFAQFVVNVGVGGDGGADVDADGRRVDQLDLLDAVSLNGADMGGKWPTVNSRIQARHKAFQHQCGFAGARHTGNDGQPALGDVHLQRLHSVDAGSGEMNFAEGEKLFLFDLFPCADIGGFGKEGSDLGGAILL